MSLCPVVRAVKRYRLQPSMSEHCRRAGRFFFFLLIISQIEWNRSVIRHTVTQTQSIRQYVVVCCKAQRNVKAIKTKKKKNPGENDDDYQDGAALQDTLLKQTLSEAIKDAFMSSKTHTNAVNSTLLPPGHTEPAAGQCSWTSGWALIMETAPFLPADVFLYMDILHVC